MGDIFRRVLDTQQSTVDIRIHKLQVFKGIHSPNHQVKEGLCELLLNVDALIHRFPHQSSNELILSSEGRVWVG